MKKRLIFFLALLCFAFSSFASAAIYKWVDKEGVVNFTDDESWVPSAYRHKIEKVSSAKADPSIPSQTSPGKAAADKAPGEAGKQRPPIAQTLIREGDFAVRLAEVLKIGPAQSEVEAESLLAAAGIEPKNGWIADYPVTPDIIGELQNAIGSAVDSGKLGMNREEAVKMFQDLAAEQGLPVKGDERQNPVEPPRDDGESEIVRDYYYTEGPPVVTYYPPPWDYDYLYAWVPYPFWYTGFWFPGFFILTDFHIHHGHHHHGHHSISNHSTDPVTRTFRRVDPTTRATGAAAARAPGQAGSRGFASPAARMGAASIFNRSANGRGWSQPGNPRGSSRGFRNPSGGPVRSIGRSYGSPSGRTFDAPSAPGLSSSGGFRNRSYSGGFQNPSGDSVRSFRGGFDSPSARTFSAPSTGGQGSFGGFRDGGSSGGFHGGGFGGFHGGGHGGGGGGGHR